MTLAARLAEDTARDHGRNPWRVADRLELPVFVESLPDGCDEFYVENPRTGARALVIASRLGSPAARHMVAHGLAHHLMHAGNRVSGNPAVVWSGRHEREAEEFAARLLVPEGELRRLLEAVDPPDVVELAEHFAVEPELIERRLGLLPGGETADCLSNI